MIRKVLKIILWLIVGLLALILIASFILSLKKKPDAIDYGMSFNVPYAQELGLDWKETYLAILDDLGVKKLRLAGQWNLIESKKDRFDFSALDFQLNEARKRDVEVILSIGRRTPRWPECHIPGWASDFIAQEWQAEIMEYLTAVVNRYKSYDNIIYWQVENEPFLNAFANEHCGDLDVTFLDKEIAHVRELDPSRPILITDSGNLGTWAAPYKRGDAFGTSVYIYFWNPEIGKFRTILPPAFYRAKARVMSLLFGQKETFLIELSLEPWLIESVPNVPIETQLERMDLDRIKEILEYAENTRFEKQYLWGAEWWYWMKQHGHGEFWDFGKEVFKGGE